jgi:hypothetical protein
MNIYFINVCIEWVFRLYQDYLEGIKYFITKNYSFDVYINYLPNIEHSINDFEILFNKIKNHQQPYKIILCGDISLINKILNKFNNDSFYFLNIEQMSIQSYYEYFRKISENINIIDYSEENIPFYKNLYKNVFLLPPYFKYQDKIEKCIDILSLTNNDYRIDILNQLNIDKKYKQLFFKDVYGEERDQLYKKTKIYINIHCSEKHKTMEMIRIVNLLKNNVIILTQNSICKDLLFINKYLLIFEKIEDIKEIIEDILDNYEKYYHHIFDKDFNENYNKFVKENIDLLLNH